MERKLELSRRHFMVVGVGAAGVLATNPELGIGSQALAQEAKPLPDYVAWKNANAMIVHSKNTMETRREYFGTSGITPIDELNVRNNLPAPDESIVADRDAWEVSVEGVKEPRKVKLGELRSLGIESVATVLQ